MLCCHAKLRFLSENIFLLFVPPSSFSYFAMDCLREVIKRYFSPTISDPESQADDDSREILKVAKEMLLQGLIDENAELQ